MPNVNCYSGYVVPSRQEKTTLDFEIRSFVSVVIMVTDRELVHMKYASPIIQVFAYSSREMCTVFRALYFSSITVCHIW